MGSCISAAAVDTDANLNLNLNLNSQAIVVWDIENVQPPNISIHDLMRHIRNRFVTAGNYTEHSTICSLTNISMKTFDAKTIDELVSCSTCVLLASAFSKKRDADFVLLRELMRFTSNHKPERSKIILITGDADYTGFVNMALHRGFNVQLIFRASCGKQLLSLPFKNSPVLWDDLVTECNGGVKPDMERIHYKRKTFQSASVHTQTMTLEPGIVDPKAFKAFEAFKTFDAFDAFKAFNYYGGISPGIYFSSIASINKS